MHSTRRESCNERHATRTIYIQLDERRDGSVETGIPCELTWDSGLHCYTGTIKVGNAKVYQMLIKIEPER
jgi:hypothetical protein